MEMAMVEFAVCEDGISHLHEVEMLKTRSHVNHHVAIKYVACVLQLITAFPWRQREMGCEKR